MTADEKHINSTLRVVIRDIKEGTKENKQFIILNLKHCLSMVEIKF